MATGIGACMVLCISTFNRSLLAATMAFSAGVMVYVSLVEVVAVSSEYFESTNSKPVAYATHPPDTSALLPPSYLYSAHISKAPSLHSHSFP